MSGWSGDDQQLAAIGAGGVLRDIKHTHGALHLTELYRFTNPAEAAASLALRGGKPDALDFYLNHGRVHVGDLATTTADAFRAWAADQAAGLDAIMIAPTRDLVADLNRRARAHRLNHSSALPELRLADGNQASVGDVIITRRNDRRLRLTATDWVKNGDRWTVTQVGKHGGLTVRHTRSRLTVRLPLDYVRESTGLGYATTIHVAQGVTADTMHGLVTSHESRQQLYTMLTRGRTANDLYLQVVGDGDPHSIIRHETLAPRTPTETLQQILARDDAPTSAATLLSGLSDPAARLFEAVQRADQIVPHLTRTGLRWSELRAVRVRNFIEVPMPMLVVDRAEPEGVRVKTTKSDRSRRVPIADRVLPLIRAGAEGRGPDERLFVTESGHRLHATALKRTLAWSTVA